MKLQIRNSQNKINIDKRRIRSTVLKIMKMLDCADQELSISLVDNDYIQELNKHYLGRDKTTNVISFSIREGEYGNINPQLLGDVIISVDTAMKDAAKGKLSIDQEIDFLMIHGILHLLGFNHENTSQAETNRMQQKEKDLFNKLYQHHQISI